MRFFLFVLSIFMLFVRSALWSISSHHERVVAVIEPCYAGLGYVDAVVNRGYSLVTIVSHPDNPKKYGYEGKQEGVIVADIRDAESIIQAISASPYKDRIEVLLSGSELANHLAAKVAHFFQYRGFPYNAAFAARFKDVARNIYAEQHVPNALFSLVKTVEEAALAAKNIGYPIVIKPTDSSASQNVVFIPNEEALFKMAPPLFAQEETFLGFKAKKELLIEEYLSGPEFSVELVMYDNEPLFSSVTEKMTTPLPYFVEIGHVVPTSVHQEATDNLVDTAIAAVRALGFSFGAFHIELRLTSRGPVIIETNGRPGGDLISTDLLIQAYEANVFEATIDTLMGKKPEIAKTKNNSSAIAFLYTDREGKIRSVEGLEDAIQSSNIVKHAFSVQPGQHVVPARSSSDRLGYVIARGSTPDEAKQAALNAIGKVRLIYE